VGMLFYIYLFAMEQSKDRQRAWFRSFVIWLLMEIFMVSTLVVYITHFLVPSFIMKDVTKIKLKLLERMRQFRAEGDDDGDSENNNDDAVKFNAAQYFFVSRRLSEKYSHLRESSIIRKFSTPWPLHSYSQTISVSDTYSRKYVFIANAITMVLIYLIKGLISMPSSIQDMLIQIASTGGIGYVIVLLVQLYRIHPILPFVPVIVVAIIIHFFTHTNKDQTFARLSSSVVPLPDKNVRLPRLAPETSITNTANKNHTTRRQSVMAGI
jgi:hypothetical protein